ncbi:MAG: hypothetical protein K2X39_01115, partial [Silvanigrellaceae bacterium]|nr:hypothetical protein [Silvanigrellaceae bacterium]
MAPRVHPLFPTREEVTNNPNLAYSDHALNLIKIPLGEGLGDFPVLSLNILGPSCSGIHHEEQEEKKEVTLARYHRIAAGLVTSSKRHQVEV